MISAPLNDFRGDQWTTQRSQRSLAVTVEYEALALQYIYGDLRIPRFDF